MSEAAREQSLAEYMEHWAKEQPSHRIVKEYEALVAPPVPAEGEAMEEDAVSYTLNEIPELINGLEAERESLRSQLAERDEEAKALRKHRDKIWMLIVSMAEPSHNPANPSDSPSTPDECAKRIVRSVIEERASLRAANAALEERLEKMESLIREVYGEELDTRIKDLNCSLRIEDDGTPIDLPLCSDRPVAERCLACRVRAVLGAEEKSDA